MLKTAAAVLYTTAWQSTNGVITEGGVTKQDNDVIGFKSKPFSQLPMFAKVTWWTTGILIRALHEVWARNPGDAQLRDVIQSYINVQV